MDFYAKLGVEPVINAAGTLTSLGGSIMDPEVTEAMVTASRHYVDMRELHEAAGRYLAESIGVEAAHITSCATAGIAVMAAACMTGGDRDRVARLPDTTGMKSRFIVQKTHRTGFAKALELSGGRFVEVEPEMEALRAVLDDSIAGVFYTFAWFCSGKALSLPQVSELARARAIPVIVDAAAEVPPVDNLTRFLTMGADLVTFSGGKAMEGPQSSGLVLGRRDLIAACALNDCPNMGVGRGMKVAKEEIAGLVTAVDRYLRRDHAGQMQEWEERVAYIIDELTSLEPVEAFRQMPSGIGQQIPHAAIRWDEKALGISMEDVVDRLMRDRPRVAVQLHAGSTGEFDEELGRQIRVHPHSLTPGQERIVVERLKQVITGT